jgi:NADPH:quinone reductase
MLRCCTSGRMLRRSISLRKQVGAIAFSTMRAVVMREFGDPSVLKMETVEMPQISSGKCVVQLHACGVNPVDTYIRSGKYPKLPSLPHILGKDGSGIISSLAPDSVSDLKVGDRVYIFGALTGSYAQYTLCDSTKVFKLPSHISFEKGACLGTPAFTAYRALFEKAKAQAGETVFIHGASGGVGLAAIQLAQAAGLQVTGTASSQEGLLKLQEMGVTAFNHKDPTYLQQIRSSPAFSHGFDICLEMLASTNLSADFSLMKPRGRIAIIGNRGEITINPRDMMTKELSVYGVTLFQSSSEELNTASIFIHQCLEEKKLDPVVSMTLSLEDAGLAHQEIIDRKSFTTGNLVLLPPV